MTASLIPNGSGRIEGTPARITPSDVPPPLTPVPTQRVAIPFSESTAWLLSQPKGKGIIDHYWVLPASLAEDADRLHRWRIELHCIKGELPSIGLDLVGDTIVGRSKGSSPGPDLDLGELNAETTRSISRTHAMLRPTEKKLFVIDLNSTNGTMRNAIPVASNSAQALNHGDTISFGEVAFLLRIVERPGERPLADTAKHQPDSDANEQANSALVGLVQRLKHFVE